MSDLLDAGAADLVTLLSPEGVYSYVSPVARRMLGREAPHMIGRPWQEFVHPDDVDQTTTALAKAMSAAGGVVVSRHRLSCADGGYLWTESAIRAVPPRGLADGTALLASVRDIGDRRVAEARLEHRALTDPLTGVSNRTVLMDRLDQGLRRLHRAPSTLALIYLDLDRFKIINDSLGHRAGDEVLRKVAERTVGSLRPSDTLARLGGDEFVVLAENLGSQDEARQLAERVCAAIEDPFEVDGESFVCTASAGVATTTDPGHVPEGLLQDADLALYRAKGAGRNRADVFDEELRSTALRRLRTEQMLRLAIAEEGLVVQYQPIVCLPDGHIVAAEALVRVRTGEELMKAEGFIAVAEDSGLLAAIDAWVLPRAVDQAARWCRELGTGQSVGVSVNVSARQLADAKLVAAVEAALSRSDLPRSWLHVEMNERVLMDATSSAMANLSAMRNLGVRIGLDDFGTGYSSLAYLRRLPLDFVKIDRSFVHELRRSTKDAAVMAAIVDLSHALGLFVIAEGVETQEQLRIVTELGCDQAQGFVFGGSVEAEECTELIFRRLGRARPGPPASTAATTPAGPDR